MDSCRMLSIRGKVREGNWRGFRGRRSLGEGAKKGPGRTGSGDRGRRGEKRDGGDQGWGGRKGEETTRYRG